MGSNHQVHSKQFNRGILLSPFVQTSTTSAAKGNLQELIGKGAASCTNASSSGVAYQKNLQATGTQFTNVVNPFNKSKMNTISCQALPSGALLLENLQDN